MGQLEVAPLKKLQAVSTQSIDFLTVIGDQLKQERRHFDDAVVNHCIRLIHDYVELRQLPPARPKSSTP